MALIIVESPTKARTFNRILKGSKYFVFATMGHFRDLPHEKMAIDFKHDFKPEYEIIKNKEKMVENLRKLASENDEIILATDPDREGESIAYHAAQILDLIDEKWPEINFKVGQKLKRIVFHEITSNALTEALDNPQTLRINLVQAQQARRILDRVVGYELSPLLWKKMGKNWLSAGRVQTVALRLIVEREKEIRKFSIEPYCQIYGDFEGMKSKLVSKEGILYEQKTVIPLFAGEYTFTKTSITTDMANQIKTDLSSDSFKISQIKESIISKFPPPPFSTSLLQQDSFQKFGYSSKMTMKLAQDLYEHGLITYHRTDSFNLSTQFVFRAKDFIAATYGPEYALEKPRGYRTKSRMAQEAHEAIRPTKLENLPSTVGESKVKAKSKTKAKSSTMSINHKRLYELIYNRAVATQMKEASIRNTIIIILSDKKYEFVTEKQQVLFDGFLKLTNPEFVKSNLLPTTLKEGSLMKLLSSTIEGLKSKPPYRYNEATLIRILEEKGIGRPSTYAPIISLIQEKNYVEKEYRYFNPTKLGEAISEYLSQAFPSLFDLNFTASMEEGLDNIAEGKTKLIELLHNFYTPFEKELFERKKDTSTIDVEEELNENCIKCGAKMIIRYSKFGKFKACSKYPECKFTKSILKIIPNKKCPLCGGDIVVQFTKTKKRFYGCSNYPTCHFSAWVLADVDKPIINPEKIANNHL
ncbi:MAG: type I DNA topoisomerase [bacterium]|nr:type I DNA topoisomerase [bacterium]